MNAVFTYSFTRGDTMPNYLKVPLSALTDKHSKITEMEYLVDILPPFTEDGPWIAGGSLLRTKMGLPMSTDIDIFFKNEQQLFDYKLKMKSQYEGKQFTYVTDSNGKYAYNIFIKYMDSNYKIQLITKKFYDGPCKVLDDFDINICQLAYDGKRLYVEQNAINSIEERTFYLNKISNGANVMSRCMKYARLGFYLSHSEIEKFISNIATTKNNTTTSEKEEYAEL